MSSNISNPVEAIKEGCRSGHLSYKMEWEEIDFENQEEEGLSQ